MPNAPIGCDSELQWHVFADQRSNTCDCGEREAQRINVTVRLKPAAVGELEDIAKAEQRTRGDMIRILLADGIKQYRRKRQ